MSCSTWEWTGEYLQPFPKSWFSDVLNAYFNYEMLNVSNTDHIIPMIRLSDVVNIGNILHVGFKYTFSQGIWRRHLLMYHQILLLNCWHRISEDLLLQFEFNDKEETFPSQVFPQVETDFQDRDIHPSVQAGRLVSRWCATPSQTSPSSSSPPPSSPPSSSPPPRSILQTKTAIAVEQNH